MIYIPFWHLRSKGSTSAYISYKPVVRDITTYITEKILNFLGKKIPWNVQESSHFLFMAWIFPTQGNFDFSSTFPGTGKAGHISGTFLVHWKFIVLDTFPEHRKDWYHMWPGLWKSTICVQITSSYIFANIFSSECDMSFPLISEESSTVVIEILFC